MWDFSTIQFARAACFDKFPPARRLRRLSTEELHERNEAARERKKSLPTAIALCWDHCNVTVLCPFCNKAHRHGISHFGHDPETDGGSRTAMAVMPTKVPARPAANHELRTAAK
jgi:hypothetical protein